MQSLFIAYNDECDSSRANHVRKTFLATGEYLIDGYSPFTTWLKSTGGGTPADLREQFDKQFQPCSAVLILIGEDCAANPWIRYAIEQAYTQGKPLLALDISGIPDEYGDVHPADINPLERFAVLERGKKIYLNERYDTYVWRDDVEEVFEEWLHTAAKNAELTQRLRAEQTKARSATYRDYEAMRTSRNAEAKTAHV